MTGETSSAVRNLVDLAAETMGGSVEFVSDDFFASKDNLIKKGRGEWDPDAFSDTGKVYDGWESRRNRTDHNDWVIIKLATAGTLHFVDIDTNHFLGNAPQFASLEGIFAEELKEEDIDSADWQSLLPASALKPGSPNQFLLEESPKVNYVRLQIYPDGGVARLRLFGRPILEKDDSTIRDYASALYGGKAILASDMFFGEMSNLLKPTPPPNMGDGWETKRRRGEGYDWVIIELGRPIYPHEIVVDTTHFKGNYPDTCSIDVTLAEGVAAHRLQHDADWSSIVDNYKLQADSIHNIDDLDYDSKISHVRLNIYPDGGVARLRVLGRAEQ